MDVPSKLTLARALDALGVDIIEAGFPIASPADSEATRQVALEVRRPVIAGAGPLPPGRHRGSGARARSRPSGRRIHTFLATSDLHLERKLRISREACLEQIVDGVTLARTLHRRCGVFGGGRDAQRPRLPVPRRRGRDRRRRDHDQPARHGRLRDARRPPRVLRGHHAAACRTPDRAIFSTHCHDDLGLAVANSLAAIQGGVRQVECTDQRHRRARRQCVARGDRDGAARPPGSPAVRHRRSCRSGCSTRASCCRASPTSRSRRTRRSSAATPSRTKPASTRTAC